MNAPAAELNSLHHPSSRRAMRLALLAALLFGSLGAAWSLGSLGQWYAVAPEACTAAAGGASAAASLRQPDCAIGQDAPVGLAAGATIQEYGGVVQDWPVAQNGVDDWTQYDAR